MYSSPVVRQKEICSIIIIFRSLFTCIFFFQENKNDKIVSLNWFELIGDSEIVLLKTFAMFLVNWLAKCCAIGLDYLQHWI